MIKKCPNGFINVTLDNCFENYQDIEILSGANQIFCNNCRQMANASTGNKMFTSPEVMTIILNRGKGLEFQVEFDYPLELNIDKYVMDKTVKNNNYELICVLTHIGPSGMAGHFIAFCKSPTDDKWYCYNDSMINEVNDPRYQDNEQIEGIPYVLFYQKCNLNKKLYNIVNNKIYSSSNINNAINSINQGYYNYNRNDRNRQNKITLYFKYDDKEVFLDVEKNITFDDIIKSLNIKYRIPKNVTLLFENNNNYNSLENNRKVRDYNLKNEDKIIIIKN